VLNTITRFVAVFPHCSADNELFSKAHVDYTVTPVYGRSFWWTERPGISGRGCQQRADCSHSSWN